MPTWGDLARGGGMPRQPPNAQQQLGGPHSGFIDVEAMAAALPDVQQVPGAPAGYQRTPGAQQPGMEAYGGAYQPAMGAQHFQGGDQMA